MSFSLLARVSRSRVTLAAPVLLCLAVAAGCSSTPEQAAAPTTAPAAVPSTKPAPPSTAPKGTTPPPDEGADKNEDNKPDKSGEGSDADGPATTVDTPDVSTPPVTDPREALPAGATAGLDDFDGNGEPDPTCGTQDFGEGLVLRIPCAVNSAHEPPAGTALVTDSLYRLPGTEPVEFNDVSATALASRNAEGAKVALVFFNADAMFATGSATFDTDATGISLEATLRFIHAQMPGGVVQVRGHTDSTGTDAANQQLSVARANAVKAYFDGHGVDAAAVTAVGFGRSRPLVQNQNPDGTDNVDAMNFNRRVEIVITLPVGR